jgi:hypothetical protein
MRFVSFGVVSMTSGRTLGLIGMAALLAGCTGTIASSDPPAGDGAQGGSVATTGGTGGAVPGAGGRTGGTPTTTGGSAGASPSTGGSGAVAGSGSGGTSDLPTPDPEGNVPYVPPEAGQEALPARTWKLTHAQYRKTVQALLGVAVDTADLEPDLDNGVYPNMSSSHFVRVPLATGYFQKAASVASGLTAAELAALVPGGQLAVASKATFLPAILERAFRRPASTEELTAYGGLFDLGASGGDAALGFRAVVRAILTSPNFLYRTELGADPGAADFSLTGHEVASLLSYSLTDAPPSAALLAAAGGSSLTATATLAAEVNALLATPEATAQLASFMSAWLQVYLFDSDDIDKDETRFPTFRSIKQAMKDEAVSFLAAQGGPAGNIPALLTTPLAMPAGPLGQFYLSEPSGSAGGTRTGVLALGALLSVRAKPTSSSPTLRGKFVRDRFLCQSIHLPEDAVPDISETQAVAMPKTTRELYEMHASMPACAGCHTLLDQVGFSFEDLDAAGRFRTVENGVPIDTSGHLLETDVNTPLANHTDLANALAESEWTRECVATQAFRFYFGQVESSRGVPPVQAARVAVGAGTFRDMVLAVMSSPSTYHRVRN